MPGRSDTSAAPASSAFSGGRTAALSSLNAGLYSTGRIMRSMSLSGSAPKFAARMNRAGVPYGGILMTAAVALMGVGLNVLVPHDAFEIVLNISSVGMISAWAPIVLCHIELWHWSRKGIATRPSFRLFGAPTPVSRLSSSWPPY